MKRTCEICKEEYELDPWSFDRGICRACRPRFFGPPIWMKPIQAGTRDLWQTTMIIHAALLLLFGLLLDGGVVSIPGSVYCVTVIIYLAVRFRIGKSRGYPILTKPQAVATLLLPVYGPAFMIALFHWAQRLRWG